MFAFRRNICERKETMTQDYFRKTAAEALRAKGAMRQTTVDGVLVTALAQNARTASRLLDLTADALEDPVVLLAGCADTYNPKTVRASMGAVFRTQPVSMTRQQAIAACREAHIPLLATAMSADAVDLRQADL